MDPMHDAMKRKMAGMKGPSEPMPAPGGGAPPQFTTGEGIDLSKIDPELLKAIIQELQTKGLADPDDAPAMPGAAGAGALDPNGVKPGSDQAPVRGDAIAAIADSGSGHESGGLRSRAAAGAKSHLESMKSKHK